MKILFATMPFDGHVIPLTGIAVHLIEQGHDVRWYAGPSYVGRLADLGIPVAPFRRAQEVNGENVHLLFPERARLKGPGLIAFDGEKIFVAEVGNHYQDIVDIRGDFAFDAFFCDAGFFAAKLVAEKLHVPVYTVGVGPMIATSDEVPPPFFGLRPSHTVRARVTHAVVRTMLNRTLRRSVDTFNAILDAEGLAPVAVEQWFDVPHTAARRYFQDGVAGVDFPRSDAPPNVTFVGPLLNPAKALPQHVAGRLQDHAGRVIVVSQGTVDNDDPGKLIVPALEALRDGPHLVVVTTGGSRTDELRRRFPQENVLLEDHLDFGALFAHADLFICNGGYGSVLSALARGVPVLGAGTREGKNDINARLDYLGLGLDLRTERPSAKQIRRGVARLLDDPALARRLQEVRAELAAHRPLEIVDRCLAADGFIAPAHVSRPNMPGGHGSA